MEGNPRPTYGVVKEADLPATMRDGTIVFSAGGTTASLFSTLGIVPEQGRGFVEADRLRRSRRRP